MEITVLEIPRASLFVPSIKCQTLLGKALQEHFTKPAEVASVFSSSPSLRNSSAGANFLTNFCLNGESAKLFETVFTTEDCFSVQLCPSLHIANGEGDEQQLWNDIFNAFFKNLTKTKYFEASLRSLTIKSPFITDEQLHFMLSNLKRITKLELNITCSGISNSIGENLPELEELIVESSSGFDASTLQRFAPKLKVLKTLVLKKIWMFNDDGVKNISEIFSITSLFSVDSFYSISR